jgi:hypothetical protein
LGGSPDIGAHEAPAVGLFPNFTAAVTSGPAALNVAFTDGSFTSDPGGIQTWAWDFENDGFDDDFTQNPNHVYLCPGTYSVKLSVTDLSNPAASYTRTNYITVDAHLFGLSTTGGGVGDLTITPVPTSCGPAAGAYDGFTFISLTTAQPVGTGPIFGIVPDPLTFQFLFTPVNVGTIPHFLVAPPAYPDGGNVVFPAGFFAILSGISLDAVMVFRNPNLTIKHWSNVVRVTF